MLNRTRLASCQIRNVLLESYRRAVLTGTLAAVMHFWRRTQDFPMNRVKHRWSVMLVVASLGALLGCQGLGSKPQTQGAGQLTPSPASISFGNVQIGTNQSQAGSITNTGGSSVTITQVAASGSGYSVSGITVPLTLAAGQGANFSVLFAPTGAGSARRQRSV
jgi:hypothetical protein